MRAGKGEGPSPASAAARGIGVDGCRAGWLGARLGQDSSWEIRVFDSIDALWAAWDDGVTTVLVDVPIGLPEASSARACDAAARAYLRAPRASSVFNPPTRAALHASSWAESARLNERACGKRISRQTWGLVPKIREVDAFLRADTARQDRLREAHPEVLFQVLNEGISLTHGKKSSDGRAERLGILETFEADARAHFGAAAERYRRSEAHLDDILDAMGAALVAARAPELESWPARPPRDAAGLRCEIVVPSGSGR